jgi:NCAIR mutase (PurE)-related protein
MPTKDRIIELLTRVQAGELDILATAQEIWAGPLAVSAVTDDAHVDLDRQRRCGFPEVIYGEGKTPRAMVQIMEELARRGQKVFATRVSGEQAALVKTCFPDALWNETARTLRLPTENSEPAKGHAVVVTAGTSDRPVAEEALETLHWMNCRAELIVDVGVAGPYRLLSQLENLRGADAIVVVAGMEGALPSVVGGHVDCPVIAVPTSVGYGANFGGLSALLGMLNSCAANVTVVNIDAGFKGGYIAGLIARRSAPKP